VVDAVRGVAGQAPHYVLVEIRVVVHAANLSGTDMSTAQFSELASYRKPARPGRRGDAGVSDPPTTGD
jgi:hypothetical protein